MLASSHKFRWIIPGTILCAFASFASSHGPLQDAGSFVGTWKGTSLCQIKNSPCHDEQVVFYITKTNQENGLEIKANKIVNGKEEFMGTIQFKYDPKSNDITSTSMPDAFWHFTRKETNLEGTLIYKNELFRIIKLTKA